MLRISEIFFLKKILEFYIPIGNVQSNVITFSFPVFSILDKIPFFVKVSSIRKDTKLWEWNGNLSTFKTTTVWKTSTCG